MAGRISVIIPVFNAQATLARCLQAVAASSLSPCECIVVNDASTDDSERIAEECGAIVVQTMGRVGPAQARNRGAGSSRGDLLVFIDADVCVHTDTLERIHTRFASDTALDAIIGSYDDTPSEPDFLSQYRNLMHHYVHQRAAGPVATFWTGCGAVRAVVFAAMGGLSRRYRHPSIEDIELGYRMAAGGHRIVLDPSVQVTHLKRWSFADIVSTDVLRRGIPWVTLMLSSRNAPNHLNVSQSQRASVVLVWAAVLFAPFGSLLSLGLLAVVFALNFDFYCFLGRKRGLWFSLQAAPMHMLYHFYNGISLAVGACVYAWARMCDRNGQSFS